MKKFTFIMAISLFFSAFATSQVLEDFEHIPMNWFSLGENGFIQVIPNPDPDGNTGHYVGEITRGQGDPWGGFWSPLPQPVDMDQYSYIFVDVWKPRISPVVFKLEQGPDPDVELESMEPQSATEEWETLVFDFSEVEGQWNVLTFFPDFIDPVDLDEDIMIYFDNIILSDNPVPGEGNELVVESFNFIHMNPMLGGEEDDSHFTIILNPDQGDANPSNYVVRFQRSQHGVPWGGFWAPLAEPVDMSEHKYVYVDVWKPRISPIRFKVEGGPGGTFEHESMEPQTLTEQWETMVFYFPEADGEYPIIAFMPDFEDPLTLDEDIVIFFDNIRVGDAPVSVEEVVSSPGNIRIFPNPANNVVQVITDAGATISLFDITGRLVEQKVSANGQAAFNVSQLSEGMYIIRVTANGISASQRLMVY